MTFWNWRRGTQPASSGSAALSLAPDLAPIELYTADSRIVGWVAAGGQRVTDLLNNHDELRLWRPAPGPIDATGVPEDRLPHPGDQNGEWQSVSAAAVLLAMPPEWRSSRQLRLHRRLRRVAIAVSARSASRATCTSTPASSPDRTSSRADRRSCRSPDRIPAPRTGSRL